MHRVLTYLSFVLIGFSCSERDCSSNRFDFINSIDSIPVMDIVIGKGADSIRIELSELYGYDPCENCDYSSFNYPFDIDGKLVLLKILVDYSNGYCENCLTITDIRERNDLYIIYNQDNKILMEGKPVNIDSLKSKIKLFLFEIGENENVPSQHDRFIYQIDWCNNCDKSILDSILSNVIDAHLNYVEMAVRDHGNDFCSLEKEELDSLKIIYPLKIEFYLNKKKNLNYVPRKELILGRFHLKV